MITVESLARDLLSLLHTLKWGELSLCGFSMGGMQLHPCICHPINSSTNLL